MEIFCPRRERRGIGFRKFLYKEKKGVGLRIICPSEREKNGKGRQVRGGVRSPVRRARKRVMIESVSLIDSKITACCRFMQPIRKKLVAALGWQQEPIGKKLALEFFCKNCLCNFNGLFLPSAFLFFIHSATLPQKVSFN